MLSCARRGDLNAGQRAELAAWRKARRWDPHQLRHGAATELRREFGPEAARGVVWHASPEAAELYAEADREEAAAAMARIG